MMPVSDKLIREFDHSDVAKLPEYAAAARALDDLAHAIGGGTAAARERFAQIAREMALALKYGDANQCAHPGIPGPYKASIDGDGWLTGTYRCGECGAEWECGWGTGR